MLRLGAERPSEEERRENERKKQLRSFEWIVEQMRIARENETPEQLEARELNERDRMAQAAAERQRQWQASMERLRAEHKATMARLKTEEAERQQVRSYRDTPYASRVIGKRIMGKSAKEHQESESQRIEAIYQANRKQWEEIDWNQELERRQIGIDDSHWCVDEKHKPLIHKLAKRQKQTLLMEADNRLYASAIRENARIISSLVEQLLPSKAFHDLDLIDNNPWYFVGGSNAYRKYLKRTEGEEEYL